ncbi:hypothetical protein ACFV0R_08990 [Streptomyces sp. NPDC059578]|uniref:hypothetical protein n=1 Tax=unclassified Streptomyces TaxID=2593676 RepID=UPI00365214A4
MTAPLEFTHATVRIMLQGSGGTVVDPSSLTGPIPGRGSASASSKAWTRYFFQELSEALRGPGHR